MVGRTVQDPAFQALFCVARDWGAEDELVAFCGVDVDASPMAHNLVVGQNIQGRSVFALAATRRGTNCRSG